MGHPVRKSIVFVVEDDESVRRSLGRLMRAEGFEVHLYEDAELFLKEVSACPEACLVLDVTMPGINGLAVQNRLREMGIQMPVIFLSARDDDATRREAKQIGAKFFFRKPVDDRTLIDAIDWAVNSDPDEHSN